MKKIVQFGVLTVAIAICVKVNGQARAQSDSTKFAIVLQDFAVYRVQGKKPFKYRDENFNLKESKTAYLVTFTFASEPKVMNTHVNFYMGDYRIPEYGGLEKGIYFRFYDPRLLESLNGKDILYQVGNQKKISLGKKFVTPNLRELKLISEEEIIKRKPK